MNCKGTDANGLCVSILLNNMGWYLGVIRKLQNDGCLIYIYTDKVQNVTPIIFNKEIYLWWYKELKNNLSQVMTNTTNLKKIVFKIKFTGRFPVVV